MKKQKRVVVPVKLARRCGLDGFSSTEAGGMFSLDLGRLQANLEATLGRSVELECRWLTSHGLEAGEPEWFAAHYPGLEVA